MKRRVKISELKAPLSKHLRHVRRGHTVTIMDRDTPIAEIVPLKQQLEFVNRADRSQKLGDFRFPPLDPPVKTDGVKILLELRKIDRRR